MPRYGIRYSGEPEYPLEDDIRYDIQRGKLNTLLNVIADELDQQIQHNKMRRLTAVAVEMQDLHNRILDIIEDYNWLLTEGPFHIPSYH